MRLSGIIDKNNNFAHHNVRHWLKLCWLSLIRFQKRKVYQCDACGNLSCHFVGIELIFNEYFWLQILCMLNLRSINVLFLLKLFSQSINQTIQHKAQLEGHFLPDTFHRRLYVFILLLIYISSIQDFTAKFLSQFTLISFHIEIP